MYVAQNILVRCLVLILLAWQACGEAGLAQSGEGDAALDWIRPEEVPARADELLGRLEEIRPGAAEQATPAQVADGLARLGPNLDAALGRASAALARSASPSELEDVRRELTGAAAPLAEWTSKLAAEAKRVAGVLDEIAQAEGVWSVTRARPETAAAGDVVERRVQNSLDALAEAGARLRGWRTRVLSTSDLLVDRNAAVEATFEKLQAAAVAGRANLFLPDQGPLWRRGFGTALQTELPRVPEEILAYARNTSRYIKDDVRPLVVQTLLALLLTFVFRSLATRARTRLPVEEGPARATRLLERPYSIGLLLALLASPALHPLAPRQLMQLLAVIALFPAARIVIHVSGRANLTGFAGLFVLFILDRVEFAFAPLPTLARATFLLTLVIALGLAFWLKRRAHPAGGKPWLRRAAKAAMAGIALALVAEVSGWTFLATLIGRGIVAGAVAFLYVYAAVIVLSAALAYALTSATLRRSHLFERRIEILRRGTESVLLWLGAAVWVYFILTGLGLRGVVAGALREVMKLGVSVGALSISIGDVLAFALTLLTAMLLARTLNAVLEEEVFPRTRLPRGIPYALSTLARYAVYSLGFLFALAAAGVQVSQVAILVGGLGVGVGLGLQDLIKNFAAGVTLLVERRVHVGDALQVPGQEVFGRVLSIGMRATVVRNWNGAEVVVPNSDLVSTAVTNWTLSDLLRRIEVRVGVAYGTEPERVAAVLLEVARSTPDILAHPPPQALFQGFGDSSLDFVLRAWTDVEYERTLSLTSELAMAVHRGLSEAGITIPFPQRDLHLASVSPAVRAALAEVRSQG